VKHAGQVDAEDAVPFVVWHVSYRAADADTGVVDQHIEPAQPRGDLVEGALNGGAVPHIADGSQHALIAASQRAQSIGRPVDRFRGGPGHRDRVTVLQQRLGNRQSDAPRAAGYYAYSTHSPMVGRVRARLASTIPTVRSVVIVGAGELGGALARQVAAADIASRVVLVDEAGTVAAGKALDIRQAATVDGYSTYLIGTADESAVAGADVIVIADRALTNAEWQNDAGVALVRRIVHLNPTAMILCAGAQHLPLVERGVREAGLDRLRLFGSAPEALRSAVISMTALEAGCAPADISLTVVGRPPLQSIVPWEDASIAGRRATDVLSPPAITRLDSRLPRLWPPGPFTLASAATRVLSAATRRNNHTVCALVAVTREEGDRGRVGMLPVQLQTTGIAAVLTPTLSTRDQVRLDTALQR
jgi:hypothetical protein